MKYYSTNHNAELVTLKDAIIKGLAPDRGLYMPERIPSIPTAFFKHIGEMSLQDIAYVVANTLFGEDMESARSARFKRRSSQRSATTSPPWRWTELSTTVRQWSRPPFPTRRCRRSSILRRPIQSMWRVSCRRCSTTTMPMRSLCVTALT